MVRYGRAKSNVAPGKYVYYRQFEEGPLEVFLRTEGFWDVAVYPDWGTRARAEHASELEEITYQDLPEEALTTDTRFSRVNGG